MQQRSYNPLKDPIECLLFPETCTKTEIELALEKQKPKILAYLQQKELDNTYRETEKKLGDDLVKVTPYDGGRKFRTRRIQKGILKQRTRGRGRGRTRSRGRGRQRSRRRTKSRR
jgi:hypothetical protein